MLLNKVSMPKGLLKLHFHTSVCVCVYYRLV